MFPLRYEKQDLRKLNLKRLILTGWWFAFQTKMNYGVVIEQLSTHTHSRPTEIFIWIEGFHTKQCTIFVLFQRFGHSFSLWYCAIAKNFYYYIRLIISTWKCIDVGIKSNIDYPYAKYIIDLKSIVTVRAFEEES